MILGELEIFKKLLPPKTGTGGKQKLNTKRIELSKLEVVQCFHASHIANRESILTYGLIPKAAPAGWHGVKTISYEPGIFLSTLEEDISYPHIGFPNIDVWIFYLPKHFLFPDEHSGDANHYYIKVSVPWYKLTLIKNYKLF